MPEPLPDDLRLISAEKLIKELEARFANEKRLLLIENAEKEKLLISDLEAKHAQEIRRVQAESLERERKALNDLKTQHEAKLLTLENALLRVKSGKDRILLTFCCIAVAVLVFVLTHSSNKDDHNTQTTVQTNNATVIENFDALSSPAVADVISTPTKASPAVTSAVKTTGNGGIFVGGSSRK